MKILVVSQHYFPENFLITEICEELCKNGHIVEVVCGLPNYPKGKIFPGYKSKDKREQIINGVIIHRCKEIGRGSDKFHLLINYYSFVRNAVRKLKKLKSKFDIILCNQLSPIFSLKPAIYYKKKTNTPLLTYCLDIWPESALGHLKNSKSFVYRAICKISKKYYSFSDLIAVTSKPFIEYLNKTNDVSLDKLIYLPQHANNFYYLMDLSKVITTPATFLFAGNLGKGQRVDVLISACENLKGEYKVLIVGDGSEKQNLIKLSKQKKLENKIIFINAVSKKELANYYKEADALILTLRGNNFVGNTVPGKLQTYMSVGKPIFASINGGANDIIRESGCGVAVTAENPLKLAEVMQDFIENPQKYSECGKKAKDYFCKHFTLDIFIKELTKIMRKIVDEKNK